MKYILNKEGLSTNMEINNFYNDMNEDENISNQSLLNQRLKLNHDVFKLSKFSINHCAKNICLL